MGFIEWKCSNHVGDDEKLHNWEVVDGWHSSLNTQRSTKIYFFAYVMLTSNNEVWTYAHAYTCFISVNVQNKVKIRNAFFTQHGLLLSLFSFCSIREMAAIWCLRFLPLFYSLVVVVISTFSNCDLKAENHLKRYHVAKLWNQNACNTYIFYIDILYHIMSANAFMNFRTTNALV